MSDARRTPPRKRDHLRMCLEDEVGFRSQGNGLDELSFVHDALPELHLDDIDLSVSFLGRGLRLPVMISSMTGGTDEATRINRTLAGGAQRAGCAMAVGSQRAALENAELEETFRVRDLAPDVPLLANLGAVQLNRGYGLEECARAVEMIEADALYLHLNSLQEVLQPEGDHDFRGLVERIAALCREAPFPVLLKTTGNGLSERTARKLVGMPLGGLEVSGAGGTSWARIEALRSGDDGDLSNFAEWGESTASSVRVARAVLGDALPLVASGGLRGGVDVAKALALGADLGGLARPLLKAAHAGAAALDASLDSMARQLRIACFYAGRGRARDLCVEDLRPAPDPGGNRPGPRA